MHGSDGAETAQIEIAYFFAASEVFRVVEAKNLLGFDAAGLARFFEALGEKPFRARQVLALDPPARRIATSPP